MPTWTGGGTDKGDAGTTASEETAAAEPGATTEDAPVGEEPAEPDGE